MAEDVVGIDQIDQKFCDSLGVVEDLEIFTGADGSEFFFIQFLDIDLHHHTNQALDIVPKVFDLVGDLALVVLIGIDDHQIETVDEVTQETSILIG